MKGESLIEGKHSINFKHAELCKNCSTNGLAFSNPQLIEIYQGYIRVMLHIEMFPHYIKYVQLDPIQ